MNLENKNLGIAFSRVFVFVVLWYSFFNSSSLVLRPYVTFIWPGLVFLGILINWKNIKLEKNWYSLSYSIFFLVCFCSVIYSSESSATIKLTLVMLLSFILVNIIVDYMVTANILIRLCLAFLLVFLVATYLEMIFPNVYKQIFFPLMEGDAQLKSLKYMSRGIANGFTTQTGVNGFWMLIGFTITFVSFLQKRGKKLFWLIISILFFIGIILTSRRSVLLISIPITISSIYLSMDNKKGRIGKLLIVIGLLSAGIMIIINALPDGIPVIDKFNLYYNTGDISNGRIDIINSAMTIFSDHTFFGVGFNGFSQAYNEYFGSYILSHNSYIQLLCEFGLIGISFYFLPFIFCISETIKAVKKSEMHLCQNSDEKTVLIISMYVQIIFLLFGLSESGFHSETYFFVFFLFQKLSMKCIQDDKTYNSAVKIVSPNLHMRGRKWEEMK